MNTTTDRTKEFNHLYSAGIHLHQIEQHLDDLDNQQRALGALSAPVPLELTDEQIDRQLRDVPALDDRQRIRQLEAEVRNLRKQRDAANAANQRKQMRIHALERQQFKPIGHQHHNAAACPECSPQQEGLRRDYLKLQAEHIHQGNQLRAAQEEIATLRSGGKLAEETRQREQRAERRIREEGAD